MHQKQGHRHSIFCFIPPYLLEEIVKNGSPEERNWALQTLGIDQTIRSARSTEQFLRAVTPATPPAVTTPNRQRSIYNANHGTNLPGTLIRSEGQGATGDAATDEAYDGLGGTFDLYWNAYQRNSIDNAGMNLLSTVHYGQNYDNAFWNGQQMVFGDGDGQYFNRFTIAIDVIGHELTHRVTSHEANLVYQNQPGALNESISDVFGSLVKQYARLPQQTAVQADWLIGAGLFTPKVKGVALRSMKAPGTAYDDQVLGKDPQPADMSHYVNTTSDYGGVHINSGIPNRAFYLTAIALGGYAWQKAGRIWYATLLDSRLQPTAQFQDFANLTADNAANLFGTAEARAVVDAWQQVGIIVPLGGKVSGNWILHFSWGPTSRYSQSSIVFNSNGTFGGSATGKWQQQDGTLLLSFDSGPAKYGGTIDGNIGSGAMSTFGGLNGCWYLTKQGTTGIAADTAATVQPSHDMAGNPVGMAVETGQQNAYDAAGNPLVGRAA
jgi:Zn-dependent metalloprotease